LVRVIFCLRRLPALSPEEFAAYWRDVHGPLDRQHAEALGIRRYEQSHTMPSDAATALAAVRGAPEPFDGVASLWFDDLESIAPASLTPAARSAARALLTDEQRFIDLARSPIWLAEDLTVV